MSQEDKSRKLTLAEVARRAGVSRSLASLALRGEPGVLPEKRAHILKVARELNYKPNAFARNLASREARIIGIVIGQIQNPFHALLAQEIDRAARAAGYEVLLSINGYPDDAARQAVDGLMAQHVAGVILVDAPIQSEAIAAIAHLLPAVYVGRYLSTIEVDCVSTDDFLGANLVVEHLAELGHERIVHIHGGSGAGAKRRCEGYVAAMTKRGFEPRITAGQYSIDAGWNAVEELLSGDHLPSAIFAADDLVAIGAINRLLKSGLSVPQDVAVVGYDDIPFASSESLSLTTIRQPFEHIAEQSVESLLKRIRTPDAPVMRILVSPRLVVRRSTRPVATDDALSPAEEISKSG